MGAISAADISQTLGNSSTKVPSEKAVADDYRNVAAADIAYSHGFAAGRAPLRTSFNC